MYFEDQLLSSGFAHVFSAILGLCAVDHQLSGFAFVLSVHCFAGSDQFTILVPFYLSFAVSDFTAETHSLGDRTSQLSLNRLLVGERCLDLGLCAENKSTFMWALCRAFHVHKALVRWSHLPNGV